MRRPLKRLNACLQCPRQRGNQWHDRWNVRGLSLWKMRRIGCSKLRSVWQELQAKLSGALLRRRTKD
eukprot:146321-Pyramimonas_sp.AAC.1